MALQLTKTSIHGLLATDAYHRVEHVYLASKTTMEFSVVSYANSNSSVAFGTKVHYCPYSLSGGNPLEQAYMHLKSLPEFSNAVDY